MSESSSNQQTSEELKHARAVHEMFSGIASKYDFLNHFLSVNIDKSWRAKVVKELSDILQNSNSRVLDVACGTGDLAIALKNNGNAEIIGTDFCRPMLVLAREKPTTSGVIPYVEADGMCLSFPDNSFDALTIAFGLRNFSNWEQGLVELKRVLKPGGRIAVLEFSDPNLPGFRQAFNFYFAKILPRIGGVVSGSRGAYEYLPDSVSKFPNQKGLAKLMRQNDFSDVRYTNLTGGIAAIHFATK